jgi:hypothetical protein
MLRMRRCRNEPFVEQHAAPDESTLRKEPSKPKPSITRRRDIGAHPVLARIPDVSERPPAKQRESRAAAAGFVDYRFDMPLGVHEGASSGHHDTRPHMLRRSGANDRPWSYGAASRVLPDSDPFAIPAATLLDRFAPVARFVTVFILVTAIGTFVLSTRRDDSCTDPKQSQPASATAPTGIHQSLEPAPSDDHPTIASPSAFGPLGANSNASTIDVARLTPVDAKAEVQSETAKETAGDGGPFEFDPFPSIEATQTAATPTLARANGEPLPKLQTTEPVDVTPVLGDENAPQHAPKLTDTPQSRETSRPPAMARLPGIIFEAPRNAYHDNHQPGLH